MKWTMCFFVRDLATRRIVHHEVIEVDRSKTSTAEQVKLDAERLSLLRRQFPPGQFDVFEQGFSSVSALYSAWPELSTEKT